MHAGLIVKRSGDFTNCSEDYIALVVTVCLLILVTVCLLILVSLFIDFSDSLFIDFQVISCMHTDRMILIVMSLFEKSIDCWYD
jgi:hypothetical protein